MKIFMLADTMDIGGAETHIWELSRELQERGHHVTVLSGGGRLAMRLSQIGVRHVALPPLTDPQAIPRALALLAKEIRRQKPHIVHAHTRRSALLCRILSFSLSFPFAVTAHAMFRSHRLSDRLSVFPPATIAVSRDIEELLIRDFSVPSRYITRIENGVDTHRFCPAPTDGLPFTVMTVSRLDRDCARTAKLLIAAAPLLVRKLGKPVRVVIVGGGDALGHIQKAAREVNQSNGQCSVLLTGSRTDVSDLVGKCHVFVGVSRAALEAMSAAKPVILCGDEGYFGIVDERRFSAARDTNFCARGCPRATVACLLSDLCYLASLSHSERVTLGTAGRVLVRRYASSEQMAKKTEAVYRRELARFRQTRSSDALIGGYYGYGNRGDELVLAHILRQQHALSQNLRLSVLTASPDGEKNKIHRYNPLAVLYEIKHCGAFILGGGSLLQDATSRRSLCYYLTLLSLANRMGIPTMLYANGLGPLSPKGLAACRRVLSSVDVISLRDAASYQTVRAMHLPRTRVILGADPVLSEKSGSHPSHTPPFLAFFPKKGLSEAEQKALIKAVAAVAQIHGFDILVAPMDPKKDAETVRRMAARLRRLTKNRVAVVSNGDRAAEALARHASLVISMRLHALILAFVADTPLVGIDCDPKISAFLREIDEPQLCLSPAVLSVKAMAHAARNALSHPHSPQIANALCRRALSDARMANALILRKELPRP